MTGKRWTEEEIELLKTLVPLSTSIDDIIDKFPGRTKCSLRTRIEQMKLHFMGQRQEWSDEEIETLKKAFEECSTIEEVCQRFPNRTYNAIERKANRLGLVMKNMWSEEEITLLQYLYPNHSNEFIAEVLGRSKKAIDVEASRQGLKKDKDYLSETAAEKFRGRQHTNETKELMKVKWNERKSDTNWKHPWLGRKHSEEIKEKIREFRKEYYLTHESPFKGKKHTEEARIKMSKPRENMSQETRQKLADLVIERNPYKKIAYTRKNGEIVYLNSSYELMVVEGFDRFNILWERNTKAFVKYDDGKGNIKRFYPDFIIKYKGQEIYLEVKGEHLLDDNFTWIDGNQSNTFRKAQAAWKEWGDKFILISKNGAEEIYNTGKLSQENIIRDESHTEIMEFLSKRGKL
ncbi:MAG: NUMOD3 domain-containing DNA-binding protein [Candidatus Njordarchaeia archaeon]